MSLDISCHCTFHVFLVILVIIVIIVTKVIKALMLEVVIENRRVHKKWLHISIINIIGHHHLKSSFGADKAGLNHKYTKGQYIRQHALIFTTTPSVYKHKVGLNRCLGMSICRTKQVHQTFIVISNFVLI